MNNDLHAKEDPGIVQGNHGELPALAAIIVTPDTYDTVRHVVRFLKKQTVADQIELVFVGPSDPQLRIDESELSCFHGWHLVEVERVESLGSAYAEGINHTHAPVIVLTHDHSFPDDNLCELFVAAHRDPWAAVGPGMLNGNPDSMISWADFYLCYGEWAHPVSPGPMFSLPSHHSSYKRDILLTCGSRLYTLMEDEYFLFRHLASQGYRFLLESGTCSTHINLSSWSTWIPSRYYKGRQFAATWAHTWSWPRRLLFTVASPLLPLVRLWRIQRRIRRGQSCGFLLRLLPIVFVGVVAEWLGQLLGFTVGMGDAGVKVEKYEFHRIHGEDQKNYD